MPDRVERGEQAAPDHATPGQRAIRRVEAVGECPIAFDQERVQAEDLCFLCALDTGPGLAHVIERASFRRRREFNESLCALECASVRKAGTSAMAGSPINQGAKAIGPAAKLATVTTSCAGPGIWPIRALHPIVCLRARRAAPGRRSVTADSLPTIHAGKAADCAARRSVRAGSLAASLTEVPRRGLSPDGGAAPGAVRPPMLY